MTENILKNNFDRNTCVAIWNMKTNMAAFVNTAYCHAICSLVFEPPVTVSWVTWNGSKLKGLHISIVFLGLFAREVDPGIIVWIDWLAKVDGVFKLLTKHPLTRVSRHLQKEEACVGFRQVVVWGRVLVKHLKRKVYSIQVTLKGLSRNLFCSDF